MTHSGRVANHTKWWLSEKAIEKRARPLDGVVRSRTVVLDAMAEVSAPRQHRDVVEAVVGGRIVYDVKEGRTLGHQRLEHPAILSRGPVVLVADQHQRRQGKAGVCRGTAIGIVGHATLDADRRQVLLQGVEYRGSAMGEAEQGQAIAANEWLAGEVFRRADDIDNAEVGRKSAGAVAHLTQSARAQAVGHKGNVAPARNRPGPVVVLVNRSATSVQDDDGRRR